MGDDAASKGSTSSVQTEPKNYGSSDPLFLHSSDHPGMVLVSKPLTGDNYLSWSRSMMIALGAKVKLGFINGKYAMPTEESADFEQWSRVDCMVTSWLLNSISKDIVDAFLYTTNARQLWLEITERYRKLNDPLLYQLQREISSISQGDQSVAAYYTTLKKLWDELSCHMPIPPCTCGTAKVVADATSLNRLMQFLMGLADSYDHVRNQILVMEPLPSINQALIP